MVLVVSISTFLSVLLLTLVAAPHVANLRTEILRAYRFERMTSHGAPEILRSIYPLLKVLDRYIRRLELPKHKARLDQLLQQAAAPGEIRAGEFIGICVLSSVATLVLGILVLKGILGFSLFLCLLFAIAGYFVPLFWLKSYVESRLMAIHRQLPYMVDLLVMAMEAGSSFLEALSIYVRDNEKDALAEEFSLFLSEINLGKTRKEALLSVAERVGSDDVRNFTVAIIQGEEMGTPIGELLKIYADGMRLKRTQRAEKIAGEAAVKILGPTMMIMVAVVLLVLGPILIKYIRGELGL